MDVENSLVHTSLLVPVYGTIVKKTKSGLGPPHTLDIITHIVFYIYDVATAAKVGPKWQHQVFNGTTQALTWLFLSLPIKTKDSVSVKKLQMGEGDWTCVKKV